VRFCGITDVLIYHNEGNEKYILLHATKAKGEWWFVSFCLNFSTKLKSVVSTGKRVPQYTLNRRLRGHKRRSGSSRLVKNLLTLTNWITILRSSAGNLVTRVTRQSRVHYAIYRSVQSKKVFRKTNFSLRYWQR